MNTHRQFRSRSTPATAPVAHGQSVASDTPPAERTSAQALLDQARRLLDAGRPKEAFDLLNARGSGGAVLKNARGVCLMRMQQPALAVRTFRSIVLDSSGISLRTDVPTLYKANFAAALLLDGNILGCQSVLDEIRDENDPGVQTLRAAIRRWVSELSFFQRLSWKLGSQPNHPFTVDSVPGDLG